MQLPPAEPLPGSLREARAVLEEAVRPLAAVREDALTRAWRWRGQDGEADVRYGFYRLYELLEEAAASAAADGGTTQAGRILGQATAARWDLHGLLLPLTGADLDRDPGTGEWTLRRTLGHTIQAQVSYSARTAYAVHRVRHDPSLPIVGDNAALGLPMPDDEAASGGLDGLRARLDEALDHGIGWLGRVDDDAALAAPTTWSNYDVDVRFRLHRWPSHLREHTIQCEKILALLGRQPSEPERLVRLILGAYGRLEGEVVARPDGSPARLVDAVEVVTREAAGIRNAAGR